MKAETIWFTLCLGEFPQLNCEVEEESEPESENEKEDQIEDDLDLTTKREQLLKEFTSPTNEDSVLQDLSIQYPIGVVPSTSLMLQFDQVLTQRLIGYHVQWLSKRISVIQSYYHLSYRSKSIKFLFLIPLVVTKNNP
jgi:hypothetical protein